MIQLIPLLLYYIQTTHESTHLRLRDARSHTDELSNLSPGAPVVTVPIEDQIAEAEGCVTFTCQIDGKPTPEITWWSGKGQLSPINRNK